MELFCYLPVLPYCSNFMQCWRGGLPDVTVEKFDSMAPFLSRLLRPSRSETCLLIAPADEDELDFLLSNANLLRDVPLVLVAPNLLSSTLAKSHRLRPRFLSDRDSDPQEVVGVLTRIMTRFKESAESGP